MKARNGFVSNSSASSFCIYGWTAEDLGMNYVEAFSLYCQLMEKYPDISWVESNTVASEIMLGVGDAEDELDHWHGEGWEDYKCPCPSKSEQQQVDEIAKEMGLPQPKMDSCTWFNG